MEGELERESSKKRMHRIWGNMKNRCKNPKCQDYPHYGGRGITYDPRWENFAGFYEDMLPTYEDDLTLDRIDVNGPYTKDNCRWVSRLVQNNNKTTTTYIDCAEGKHIPLAELARRHGMYETTLHKRIFKLKWPEEKWFDQVKSKNNDTFVDCSEGHVSIRELAQEHDVNEDMLYHRIMQGGWEEKDWYLPKGARRKRDSPVAS